VPVLQEESPEFKPQSHQKEVTRCGPRLFRVLLFLVEEEKLYYQAGAHLPTTISSLAQRESLLYNFFKG
jgi:hypothetical protein